MPTRVVSNGEYMPPPQSENQKKVEARIKELSVGLISNVTAFVALGPGGCPLKVLFEFPPIRRASALA